MGKDPSMGLHGAARLLRDRFDHLENGLFRQQTYALISSSLACDSLADAPIIESYVCIPCSFVLHDHVKFGH